jgi:hypothetical protein
MKTAAFVVAALLCAGSVGCSNESGPGAQSAAGGRGKRRADGITNNDHSLCEIKDRKDVEVSETAGPGAVVPNVRRVWKVFGVGADRRKILICREVDTNLDGKKDVVRFYTDDGQSKEERADTNFDGKPDTWIVFAKGRVAEVRIDHNYDTKIDEVKAYVDGKLSRVKRDADFNGKYDIWEMYKFGRLERMGVDLDGDERVDRWDHDTEWQRKLAQAEAKKAEDEQKKKQEEADARMKAAEDAAAKSDAAGDTKGDADKAPPKDDKKKSP